MKPSILDSASEIAVTAHSGQYRKGSTIPYIVHPIAVALLLAKYGFEDEILAAALTHDVLEDTPVTEEDLRKALGENVVSMIKTLSEDKTLPWKERKLGYIENVRNGSEGARAISLADKIHNAESILQKYAVEGNSLWQHFSQGKEEKMWFEQEMLAMFKETMVHPLVAVYEGLVNEMNQMEA